jgi:hypothetical protein
VPKCRGPPGGFDRKQLLDISTVSLDNANFQDPPPANQNFAKVCCALVARPRDTFPLRILVRRSAFEGALFPRALLISLLSGFAAIPSQAIVMVQIGRRLAGTVKLPGIVAGTTATHELPSPPRHTVFLVRISTGLTVKTLELSGKLL